jgi:hypothetical protein
MRRGQPPGLSTMATPGLGIVVAATALLFYGASARDVGPAQLVAPQQAAGRSGGRWQRWQGRRAHWAASADTVCGCAEGNSQNWVPANPDGVGELGPYWVAAPRGDVQRCKALCEAARPACHGFQWTRDSNQIEERDVCWFRRDTGCSAQPPPGGTPCQDRECSSPALERDCYTLLVDRDEDEDEVEDEERRGPQPPPSPVTTTHATVGVQAFYILFASQIQSRDWPHKICQNGGRGPQGTECVNGAAYKNGVFITSPQNITKALVEKVKSDIPGSRVLAYWDFGDIPIQGRTTIECPFCRAHIMGDRPGRNCSTTYRCGSSPFLTALQSVFPAELAVHDITDGLPGQMIESYPGLPKYVWNNRSAPLLADFLGSWLHEHGFDGLYMDGYLEPDLVKLRQCTTKEEGCTSFMKPGRKYDIDGDGLADTAATVAGSYFAWGPAFVSMMRARLGDKAVLLANSAGSISDPSLSGVTIEMEGCVGSRGGIAKCANALGGQRASTVAAGREALSILWLTHAESMSPAQQCAHVAALQKQYPWVQAGTDFFDGSHIVCSSA